MIIDNLDNLNTYSSLNPSITAVFEFLSSGKQYNMAAGKQEIAKGVYVLPLQYNLKVESLALWEAHQKYLDVHVVLEGNEKVGVSHISDMTSTAEYVDKDDYQLFTGEPSQFVLLKSGTFAIFFPQDVHKTSIGLDTESVRKLVFKVQI